MLPEYREIRNKDDDGGRIPEERQAIRRRGNMGEKNAMKKPQQP